MKWQPIETAPKDGSVFIAHTPRAKIRKVRLMQWLSPKMNWAVFGWKDMNGNFHDPTHWMPLPEPPTPTASQCPPSTPDNTSSAV